MMISKLAAVLFEMRDFLLNGIIVSPSLNQITISGQTVRLPKKFIDVLCALVERRGEVIAKHELIERVWKDPMIGDDALIHAVWALRKALGDPARRPLFIETIPGRGYRLIAETVALA